MRYKAEGVVSAWDGAETNRVRLRLFIPSSQEKTPDIRAGLEHVYVMPLGIVVAVNLVAQDHILQTQSEKIRGSLAGLLTEYCPAAILELRHHLRRAIGRISVGPENFVVLRISELNLSLFRPVQIPFHRIRSGAEGHSMASARWRDVAISE